MASTAIDRPFRAVLVWQAVATLVIAAIAGVWAGVHGALSAVLGGVINLSAGVGLRVRARRSRPAKTAGATMVAMFRAEAAKILVIIGQLWLVLATYKEVVLPAFLAAFVVTVLLFRIALFVRD